MSASVANSRVSARHHGHAVPPKIILWIVSRGDVSDILRRFRDKTAVIAAKLSYWVHPTHPRCLRACGGPGLASSSLISFAKTLQNGGGVGGLHSRL
jgi:hypothetical protein